MRGRSVRVTGRFDDLRGNVMTITDAGARLDVDVRQLESFHCERDDLVQFIGEASKGERGGAVVVARVHRIVNGLDMELYRQALQVQRTFLRKVREGT